MEQRESERESCDDGDDTDELLRSRAVVCGAVYVTKSCDDEGWLYRDSRVHKPLESW